ncbi:MAG: hypothetical protein ABL956_14565 [Hyphomonadaceae bacterium]
MIARRAENAAALWLQLEGYRILRPPRLSARRRDRPDRREREHAGLHRGQAAPHAEIRARIGHAQLRQRIEQAARIWITGRHKLLKHLWRFDIVLLAPGRLLRHMRDALREKTGAIEQLKLLRASPSTCREARIAARLLDRLALSAVLAAKKRRCSPPWRPGHPS